MRHKFTAEELARSQVTNRSLRAAEKARGMAAAIYWRESRRCADCRALAYVPCAHRPNGFGSVAAPLRQEWPL
jgi:hypothetical protein